MGTTTRFIVQVIAIMDDERLAGVVGAMILISQQEA